jgi:hypothetical protein
MDRNVEADMDLSDLCQDWSDWIGPMQAAFPNARMPDIFPRAALGEALIRRIAETHDLTPGEVREMIEDLVLHDITQAAACRAA